MLPTWEQIMDLIGSIQYMENRLGGRKPNQGKGKPAQEKTRNDAGDERNAQSDANHYSIECDTWLGRKVDTTA
jgi:hypothetical protein